MRTSQQAKLLTVGVACLSIVAAACSPSGDGGSGGTVEMNIETFGGDLGETIAEIAAGFEEEHDVKINWTEGSGVENVARVAGSGENPIYDVAFVPQQSQFDGSQQGLWAKLDPAIVDTSEVDEALLADNDDAAPVGMIVTDLYYNTEVFEEEGWQPPTSFADLTRPEFCEQVGILDPNQTYGLYSILGLGGLSSGGDGGDGDDGGGRVEAAWSSGLSRLESAKDCFPTVESSGGALEQKIQTGEYVVGTHGSVRVLPLIDAGAPVKAVTPEEGAFLTMTMVAPVKNAPNPELAQEFVNWFLSEDAQEKLMTETFYGPVISSVTVPDELVELGVPTGEMAEQLIIPDLQTVTEHRSDWFDEFQRTMG